MTTDDARDRLALALDVDDLVAALRLARRMRPWFGIAKVGLELFGAAGPDAVSSVLDEGYRVFLDLKLHDIPTTVARAARVIGVLGASFTTVHTQGGDAMMRAAVDGLAEGAAAAGTAAPCVLGVTVLTSDPDAAPEVLTARAAAAAEAGCGGLVCAAADL
ncbi:MAG: orotidine 5'-phosphate decarboxylase / HUMPS family protein, partial [Acidimicrobiales bacterium]